MAEDNPGVMHLTTAIVVRVECMRHGHKHISGSADVSNLGYGQVMLDLAGRVACTACPDDEFLYLNVIIEDTAALDKTRLRAALMEDMTSGGENNGTASQ